MWLISFTTVLLLERWGGSAGTSDSTQKAAPSARNCSDVQHFPGFALWLPLPFHTVNSFFVFVYFFPPQVIWTLRCNLQKYIIIQWFCFLLGPVCNITRHTRIMKTMNSNCRSNLRWSAISTRSKEATFSLVNCLMVSTCDWLNYAFPFLVEFFGLNNLLWIDHGHDSLQCKNWFIASSYVYITTMRSENIKVIPGPRIWSCLLVFVTESLQWCGVSRFPVVTVAVRSRPAYSSVTDLSLTTSSLIQVIYVFLFQIKYVRNIQKHLVFKKQKHFSCCLCSQIYRMQQQT